MMKCIWTWSKAFATALLISIIAILLCSMLSSCDETTSKVDSSANSATGSRGGSDSDATEDRASEEQMTDSSFDPETMEERRANPPIPQIEGCSLLESYYCSIAGNETIEELQQRAESCGLYAYSYDGGASFFDLQVSMGPYSSTSDGSEKYTFSGDSIWITYDTGRSMFWHATYKIKGSSYSAEIDGTRSNEVGVRYRVMKGDYAVDPTLQYSSAYEALGAARALA